MTIEQIHEDVYQYLKEINERNPGFLFTFRRSDANNRLSKRYWFYGNERYMSVSFWSGTDYKKHSPNICFVVTLDGKSFLDINVSDSDLKKEFVERYLMREIPLFYDKGYLRKYYDSFGADFIKALDFFIHNDKIVIDRIIQDSYEFFSRDPQQRIGFINHDDFFQAQDRVLRYRLGVVKSAVVGINIYKIAHFHVENSFPIKNLSLADIPFESQWVFLTGDNGTGKTSILKEIVKRLSSSYQEEELEEKTSTYLRFYDLSGNPHEQFNNVKGEPNTVHVPANLAVYGASRLKVMEEYHAEEMARVLQLSLVGEGLFNDIPLLDLHQSLKHWKKVSSINKIYNSRLEEVKLLLVSMIPNLYDIRFEEDRGVVRTIYVERDERGNEMPEVNFQKLASGLKSLVGMLGDLLIRFWANQPADQPSDFRGIVIIDEIDVHLHPINQKSLVEKLTAAFPKIQFIVTTHSPIPLLGAPENSVFYKISRTVADGVIAENLSSIDFRRLLPNAILSSELFQMGSLFKRENIPDEEIRTEDSIAEIETNDETRLELNQIADRLMRENNG